MFNRAMNIKGNTVIIYTKPINDTEVVITSKLNVALRINIFLNTCYYYIQDIKEL